MGQEEPSEAVEHLQGRIAVRHDLTHEGVDADVTVPLLAKLAALRLVLHGVEPIHRRLEVQLHFRVILCALPGHGLVEDAGERLDLAPEVHLRGVQLMLELLQLLRVRALLQVVAS